MPGLLCDLPHPRWGMTHFIGPLCEKQGLGVEVDCKLLIYKGKTDIDLSLHPLKNGTKIAYT